MGQQYNKVIKRKRRLAYLKRKKGAVKLKKISAPAKPKPETPAPPQA